MAEVMGAIMKNQSRMKSDHFPNYMRKLLQPAKMNIFFVASLFLIAMGPSQMALAQNYAKVVRVCNKGNVDLKYMAFATRSSLLGGEGAKISGWHPIKRGKCQDVNPRGFSAVTVGFLQTNSDGITGNPVYNVRNTGKPANSRKAPATICAPINDKVDYKSALGIVRDKYLPPCREGFAEFRMSFYVRPGDVVRPIHLKPRSSDQLNPWPIETAAVVSRPSQGSSGKNSAREMSGVEILGKILLGAAQGLEDAKIKKISSACGKNNLTFAFAFTEEGPAKACECLSRKIVRSEGPESISRMIADIDAGRGFDELVERLPEEKFTQYLESCVSSSGAASPSPQTQPIKQLTLEQKAAAMFPDPVKPSYAGEPEYKKTEPTRRIQGYMKRWEEMTGKNFLTDHWSMKPREGRNKNGVLTKPARGYGVWPNILNAYDAAEKTILNSYTTQWYRVASVEEMRQCVPPPAPKKPRVCSDPERSFMFAECVQISNWREPEWCRSGHDLTDYKSGISRTEHGGQASYGNLVGDCLVKADAGGSPFIETRNNGKEIRGFFFKDDLLKNAYVSAECGKVWRDFATAVYKARTDQEFVAANPMSVIISNMNAQAGFETAKYHDEKASVQRQREVWIAQEELRKSQTVPLAK